MQECINCGHRLSNYSYMCPNCNHISGGIKRMRLRGVVGFLSLGLGILIGIYVSWWLAPIVFLGGTTIGNAIFK